MAKAGSLYLVPTPVGNLKDITLRALDLLNECDVILAEDTRNSAVLLNHYNISKPLWSFHAHNEHEKTPQIIKDLQNGQVMCLVTDAGTPGISDPGFLIVRECLKAGVHIECLPGATAFVPALVKSGLPGDRFAFEGFIPVKKGRQTRLKSLENETRTMVFYESPYKLIKFLEDIAQTFGAEREASVTRELSKLYEQTVNGTLAELISHFKTKAPKGEFVVIVKGKDE